MDYSCIKHIEKACACPCGNGKIISGKFSMGETIFDNLDVVEIECPMCYQKYKVAKDGLLPKDFPDYKGDEEADKEVKRINKLLFTDDEEVKAYSAKYKPKK